LWYPFEKYIYTRVEFLAKPGQPIRYSVEDKGRFLPVDVNRWISEHTISAQPGRKWNRHVRHPLTNKLLIKNCLACVTKESGHGKKHERTHQMYSKNLKMIVWVGLLVLCLSSIAWSQNPMLPKTGKKKAASEGTEYISLPKDLNATQIDHIIAGLSDEQARRLLINELKLQAQQ
jgi:hypothetical protein